MRLGELHLQGFGHFRQQTIGPISSPITVFYGPNEAGKSTLLAFIRAILFGFPARFNSYYRPLGGGRHGGRITLTNDDGLTYLVERFAGSHGGLSIVTPNGPASDAELVLRQLTGSATPNQFRTLFAFSLDELQEAGSLQGSSIYSVGQGAPALPALQRELSDYKGKIYLSKGSNQEVPRLLDTLKGVDEQLRAVEGNAEVFGGLTARESEIDGELQSIDVVRLRLNDERAEVEKLLSGWDDWVALTGCEAAIEATPRFEQFPENPIPRLEGLEARLRQAKEDREEAAKQLQLAGEAASAVLPDEDLLADVAKVEEIRRARSSFDNSVHDLPERQAELRELEANLSDSLGALGSGWNETNLYDLDTSITTHEGVDGWKAELTDRGGKAENTGIRLEQESSRLEELRGEERDAQNRLRSGPLRSGDGGPLNPANGRLEELLDDRGQLERIRRGRGSFDGSVRDLPERLAELAALESDLVERLRDFGSDWDEARLDEFDTSIAFRQEVERFKEGLAERATASRRSGERLERERAELTECQNIVREAQERMPESAAPLDTAALEKRRATLRVARGHFNDYERSRLNRENLQGQLNALLGGQGEPGPASGLPSLTLPVLLATVGVVLIAAGFYFGESALPLSLISGLAGLVLLGAAGYLAVRRPVLATGNDSLSAALAQQRTDAETAEELAWGLLVEAAGPLDIAGDPTGAVLDSAEARLESVGSALNAWKEANDRVEEAERNLKSQEQRVAAALRQEEADAAFEVGVRQEWQSWLVEHGLRGSFTPDTMIEFMGRVETTRVKLEQVRGMRHRVEAIRVDAAQYLALVQPLAEKYGIPVDSGDHQQTMAVADVLIRDFDRVGNLVVQRDDVVRRLQRQEEIAAAATDEQRSAVAALSEAQARWRGWLEERDLRDSFTPETMLEFLARVDTARSSRAVTQRMRDRVAAIQKDIDEFLDLVTPLAGRHELPLDAVDRRQMASAADELIKRLSDAQRLSTQREQAKEREEEHQGRLEMQDSRLQSVHLELADLLTAGGTEDPEEFRRRARQSEELLELERKRDEHRRSLEHLSGTGDRFEAICKSLDASDPSLLNQESRQLSERVEAVDTRRNELFQERGGIDIKLRQLLGEEQSSALRVRRESLLEQLRVHAREWSRLTIAEALLEKTRQKFERERQPSVIRHAEGFFSNVTDRRYQRLYAPIGEQAITVVDVTGTQKQPAALSRGTREQLYLALRFGLIRESGEHAERLPVVVDEVLVNFDPERARLAAESFAELAQTNQVLVFTCHPATRDMFVNVGAHVLDISRTTPEQG